MFIGYEQIAVSTSVLDVDDLTIPSGTSHAELQAGTNHVAYTMDGTAPTSSTGMLLLTTEPPRLFLIEDVLRMKFIQRTGGGTLNIHYIGAA